MKERLRELRPLLILLTCGFVAFTAPQVAVTLGLMWIGWQYGARHFMPKG